MQIFCFFYLCGYTLSFKKSYISYTERVIQYVAFKTVHYFNRVVIMKNSVIQLCKYGNFELLIVDSRTSKSGRCIENNLYVIRKVLCSKDMFCIILSVFYFYLFNTQKSETFECVQSTRMCILLLLITREMQVPVRLFCFYITAVIFRSTRKIHQA